MFNCFLSCSNISLIFSCLFLFASACISQSFLLINFSLSASFVILCFFHPSFHLSYFYLHFTFSLPRSVFVYYYCHFSVQFPHVSDSWNRILGESFYDQLPFMSSSMLSYFQARWYYFKAGHIFREDWKQQRLQIIPVMSLYNYYSSQDKDT